MIWVSNTNAKERITLIRRNKARESKKKGSRIFNETSKNISDIFKRL
jgi:hypothetical protein